MEEKRIISIIGMYSCGILASIATDNIFPWIWTAIAVYYAVRYIYLVTKK